MNIVVIGKGKVGGTLGERLATVGHTVRYAGRGTVAQDCNGADVIIVATPAMAVSEIATELSSVVTPCVVVDAVNSIFAPPAGYPTSTHAFAAAAPALRVVKCFNTVGYEVMGDPVFGEHRATMFMAGDDEHAKSVARELANEIGFGSCEDVGGSDRFVTLEHVALAWISMSRISGKGRTFAWHLLGR